MSDLTFREIWDTLSKINVNDHVQEKNGLSYLSWTFAWEIMMDHYPDLTIEWHGKDDAQPDVFYYEGGTVIVACTVTIGGCSRHCWLPVMTGYKNTAVARPDSRAISDAKQRCLVKCFALFGLGLYIYAGDDLPRDERPQADKEVEALKVRIKEITVEAKNNNTPISDELQNKVRDAYSSNNRKKLTSALAELTKIVPQGD